MTQQHVCLHGTCVSLGGDGVLILGGPGAGKSDLALRLVDAPGFGISGALLPGLLVSDDQVVISRDGGRLVATAPEALHGKLEIRGLGIVTLAVQPAVALALVVRLEAHAAIERLPASGSYEILGLALPMVEIDGKTASAPARLRAALNLLKQQGAAR